MCLIAYLKAGAQIPEEYFRSAAKENNDGIGIMSAFGVEKFLGRKMVKRAWREARRLQDARQEFAVHFRFATHGRVALINTHPFKTPDGNAYVMHNGILNQYTPQNRYGDMSDTRALVKTMRGIDVEGDAAYWKRLEEHIGWSNKLCVMSHDGQFRIVNESAGDWISNVWYSQTYSLPGMEAPYGKWWDKYVEERDARETPKYLSDGRAGGSYYIDSKGVYHELYVSGSNHLALPYDQRSTLAALERRDGASGSGTHSLPAGTYYRDDEALDAELDKHFANGAADDDEATDICPSCETLHSEGRQCPECGFIDMSDGMLDGAQAG